jgi:hypothetical protein
MPGYIPQDLFNYIAVTWAQTAFVKDPKFVERLSEAIDGYKYSYPAEDLKLLRDDIRKASHEVLGIAREVYEAAFRVFDESKVDQMYFAILAEFGAIANEKARKERPWWRRILGGTRFNYESRPITNRVDSCKKRISVAAMIVLAKQLGETSRVALSPKFRA